MDVSTGRFLYRKAYSSCLLVDDEPPMILSEEQQPLIDGMPSPPMRPEPVPGSVPATDKVEAKPAPPPDLSALYKKCAAAHPRGWRASDHTVTKLVNGKWVRGKCELLP